MTGVKGRSGRKPRPPRVALMDSVEGQTKGIHANPGMPEPPEDIDEVGRKHWVWTCEQLLELGTLSRCDRVSLEVFCRAYSDWVTACRRLKKEGLIEVVQGGNQRRSGWQAIRQDCEKTMHVFMSDYGLTYASRARMPSGDKSSGNAFHDWLKKRGTQAAS